MGQKTHPKGFRLVTTQKHLSEWYGNKKTYPALIEEDYFIREKISTSFDDFLMISKVEINRISEDIEDKEYVNITIHALFPRAKEMYRKVSTYFVENTENADPKTLSILNTPKGTLKRFTSLLLKRNIRKIVRELQLKTVKIIILVLILLKIHLKMQL